MNAAATLLSDLVVNPDAPVDPESATGALFACGLLIEFGADPLIPAAAILAYSRVGVSFAANFQRALQKGWVDAEAAEGSISDERRREILEQVGSAFPPEEILMGNLFQFFSPPLLAVLLRAKEVRQRVRADAEFLADLHTFARYDQEPEGVISKALTVLDDEILLILHPSTRQGFRVRIAGITHNFQLHTLLADILIGDVRQGLLPGKRPHPAVVAASRDGAWDSGTPAGQASFHLQDWTALNPDGTLHTNPFEHVIPHEGSPADIPIVEGQRIVLLSPATLPRSWKAPRDFPEMVGECEVVEIIPTRQVEETLSRLAARPRPGEGNG
jgi:hypothetical protein